MEKELKLYIYVDGINDTPFPTADNQISLVDFTYDAKRMGGAPTITSTVMYESCLDDVWTESVYAVFKGGKYFLKQIPTSSYSNTDARYKHEIELVNERVILDNVYFYDVVASDATNDKPVSNSSVVSFYGTIHEFAKRLNYSLQYAHLQEVDANGDYVDGYRVIVDDGIDTAGYLMSFSDQFFTNVLQEIYNTYEVPYYFVNKEIHIGYSPYEIDEVFQYGVDNALLSITKTNANYKVVNRATGIGSADNIPYYYPNMTERGDITAVGYGSIADATITVNNPVKYASKISLGESLRYVRIYGSGSLGDLQYNLGNGYAMYQDGGVPFQTPSTNTVLMTFRQQVTLGSANAYYFTASITINQNKYDITPEKVTNCAITNMQGTKSYTMETFKYSTMQGFECKEIVPAGDYYIYFTCNITKDDCGGYTKPASTIGVTFAMLHTDEYNKWYAVNSEEYYELSELGIELDATPELGDEIIQEKIGYVNPQTNLMPSIYRETSGAERFYNALNDTYINPDSQTGEYYTFENPYTEGNPKEQIVSFEDIKPTIVGMTNASGNLLGMFTEFAYDEDDNDETEEIDGKVQYKHPYFFGKLRKFDGEYGFNLFDQAIDEEEMSVSFTSGNCGGCEFIIGVSNDDLQRNLVQVDDEGNLLRDENGNVRCGREYYQSTEVPQDRQNDTQNYEVWVALRKDDSTFGTLMPNATFNYKPKASTTNTDGTYNDDGDTFAILHIDLPKAYIIDAEDRLKEEIIKYMAENNSEKFNFSITFSRIYLAENEDIAEQLTENAYIKVAYNGREYPLYVSSYSYKMASSKALPEITVELSDTLSITQNALQNAISEVKGDVLDMMYSYFITSQSSNISNKYLLTFLRKDTKDTAKDVIHFNKGITFQNGKISSDGIGTFKQVDATSINAQGANINTAIMDSATSDTFRTSDSFVAGLLGASGALWEDENGVAHLHTDELVVRQTMTILELIIQKAKVVGGMLVVSAASGKITDYYYDDGNVGWMCVIDYEGNGHFQEGDLVRCSRWDKTTNTLHSYWEEVVEVFTGDDFEAIILSQTEGNALPQVGDNLVLMGNVSDTSRQGFITISVEGGTPKIDEYDGVKSKSLVGCLKGRFGDLSGITWQGEELSGYGIWTENLCATGKLVVDGKPISDYIATKTTEALGDAQGANRNLLVGTNQGTTNWFGAYSAVRDGSSYNTFYKSEIEYQGQKGVKFEDNGDYADGGWFNMRYPIATSKLVAPKTYTVSMDVYLWDDVTETLYLYCTIRREADSGNPLTGSSLLYRKPVSGGWQHVTFVMPLLVAPNTDYNDYTVVFELRDVNGGHRLSNGIRFVNLMCGEGNIPSSWSPSPEDTETKINEVTTTYDSKFEVVNGQLTSLQTKTTELTTAIEDAEGNISDIEKRVTTNESSIKQNADAIALEVTNRTKVTDDLGEQISENTALIEQTASEIRSEVSQEINDVNGNIDAMYSQIKQEADSIALVINRDNKLALQLGACNLLLGTANGLVDKWRAVDSQASLKKRQYTASDGTLGVEIYRDAVLSTTPAYEYVGYELLPEKIVGRKIYVVSFDVTLTHSASQSVYPRVCLRGVSNSSLSSFVRASSAITSGTKTHYDIQVYGANSGISGSIYVVGIDFVNSSNTSTGVWGNWTSVKVENMMLQVLGADGTIQSYTQAPEDFPNALEETGIFINERQIKLKADNVQVENNDGETTFLLDSDGRLNTNLITAKEIIAADDAGEIVASMNASNDRAYKVYHSNGNPMLVIGKYNVTDKDGVEWIMMISCFDEAGLFLWGMPYGTTGQFSTPTLPYNWSEVKFCDPSLYSLTDTNPTALMKVVQSVTYYKFNSDDTTSANQYAQYNSKVCYSSGVDGLSNPIADGIYWSTSIATFGNTTNGVVTSYTHTRLGTKYEGGFPVNDGTLYRITWKTYPTADDNTELT